MKMKIARKALWLVDLALAALVVMTTVEVLAERGAAGTVGNTGTPWVEKAPDPLSQPLSEAEAQQMLTSGKIVPLPPKPKAPPERPPTDRTPDAINVADRFGYTLVGTAVKDDFAYAFFADKRGAQIGAGQGDKVGPATIVGIWEGRVLIEIGGQKAYLNVKKGGKGTSASPVHVASVRRTPRQIPTRRSPGVKAGDEGEVKDEGDGEEDEEDEEDFDELDWNVIPEDQYEDYCNNIGKYISEIVILAHYDKDKKRDGLLLSKVPKTSEAYKRGLRQGDIVKSIQGTSVTTPETAVKAAFQVLKDEEYLVDITVVRNGKQEVLSYEIWPE